MNHIPKLHDLERSHGVTWNELTALDPRLNELLWQARAAGVACDCQEDVRRVFAAFRNALYDLVGFRSGHASHPVLGSVGAYEVAYWRLHDAVSGLPPRSRAANAVEEDTLPRPQRRRQVASASGKVAV
jgi:hypothetical protein